MYVEYNRKEMYTHSQQQRRQQTNLKKRNDT